MWKPIPSLPPTHLGGAGGVETAVGSGLKKHLSERNISINNHNTGGTWNVLSESERWLYCSLDLFPLSVDNSIWVLLCRTTHNPPWLDVAWEGLTPLSRCRAEPIIGQSEYSILLAILIDSGMGMWLTLVQWDSTPRSLWKESSILFHEAAELRRYQHEAARSTHREKLFWKWKQWNTKDKAQVLLFELRNPSCLQDNSYRCEDSPASVTCSLVSSLVVENQIQWDMSKVWPWFSSCI